MSTDPVFMKVGNQYYWYHNDHLGTPQMMTTTSGAVVWKAKYSSFGKVTVDPSATVGNPLRFPGQYEDTETGLHYNYHRHYDPKIGRYLMEDPIGIMGGSSNYFMYCFNKPVAGKDPMGLDPGDLLMKITGQKVRKAWGITASAAAEARVGYGALGGIGMIDVFFPDTCEIGTYVITTGGFPYEGDPSDYDAANWWEFGLYGGFGAGQEVAEWFGNPNSATPESFAGPFHTAQTAFSIPGTPFGGGVSAYLGEFSREYGGLWIGGTGTVGPGAGFGVMTWDYEFIGKYEVEDCICNTLTLIMP